MTIISSTDITYNLSGGSTNSDPDASLGGDISVHPIVLERLFKNVSPDEALSGKTDYRCIYLKNNSLDATLFQSEVYINYKVSSDVQVYLGFPSPRNEKQIIVIVSYVALTGGYITIQYTAASGTTYSVNADWDADDAVWASNIQTSLRTISGLEDITVSVFGFQEFQVNFDGKAGSRLHNNLVIEEHLTYIGGTVETTVGKFVSGSPINTTAEIIDVETTTPYGVDFGSYSPASFYSLGRFLPNEKTPLWIKRVVPAGAGAVENDGITIRLLGTSADL